MWFASLNRSSLAGIHAQNEISGLVSVLWRGQSPLDSGSGLLQWLCVIPGFYCCSWMRSSCSVPVVSPAVKSIKIHPESIELFMHLKSNFRLNIQFQWLCAMISVTFHNSPSYVHTHFTLWLAGCAKVRRRSLGELSLCERFNISQSFNIYFKSLIYSIPLMVPCVRLRGVCWHNMSEIRSFYS